METHIGTLELSPTLVVSNSNLTSEIEHLYVCSLIKLLSVVLVL
jgi:hypothetical protein